MDFSKYPIEKLFYFVAGIIPGFVALLIFQMSAPGSFRWFFTLSFLGYKTKLSLITLVAFVIGNSLTTFLGAILGAIGGAIGGVRAKRPYMPPPLYRLAPWRDPRWRMLVKKQLGAQAPNDTQLMPQAIFDQNRTALDLLPEEQRPASLAKLNLQKIKTEIDDTNWERWYDHYHRVVIEMGDRDFISLVRKGFNFNLETAALYVLISAIVVPDLRHWWCVLPASMWCLILLAQEFSSLKKYTDKWLTLFEQIKYLSQEDHGMETVEPRLDDTVKDVPR